MYIYDELELYLLLVVPNHLQWRAFFGILCIYIDIFDTNMFFRGLFILALSALQLLTLNFYRRLDATLKIK